MYNFTNLGISNVHVPFLCRFRAPHQLSSHAFVFSLRQSKRSLLPSALSVHPPAMASTMLDAVSAFKATDCFRELQDIVTKFEKSEAEVGNVETKDAILDICLKHKFAEHRVLHCKQVGAWPGNRGGEGLLWRRARVFGTGHLAQRRGG